MRRDFTFQIERNGRMSVNILNILNNKLQIVIRAEHDRQSMHNELVNTRTACDQLSREKVILLCHRCHYCQC